MIAVCATRIAKRPAASLRISSPSWTSACHQTSACSVSAYSTSFPSLRYCFGSLRFVRCAPMFATNANPMRSNRPLPTFICLAPNTKNPATFRHRAQINTLRVFYFNSRLASIRFSRLATFLVWDSNASLISSESDRPFVAASRSSLSLSSNGMRSATPLCAPISIPFFGLAMARDVTCCGSNVKRFAFLWITPLSLLRYVKRFAIFISSDGQSSPERRDDNGKHL